MRLTRWKLMAGVLGLSMCGLAALAEPACRSMGITSRADDPKPDTEKPVDAAKSLPLPAPIPLPANTEVPPPVIPAVSDTKPVALPSPVPVDVKPIPLPEKNDPKITPAVDIKLLEDVHKVQNPPVVLPTLSEDLGKKGGVTPIPTPTPPKVDPTPVPVGAPTIPMYSDPVVPVKNEKPAPQPVPDLPPKRTDIPFTPKEEVKPLVVEPVKPVGEPAKPAGVAAAKKLKVMLHLSDDKPWFEVRDGEDLVLKVTADAVNLSATADKNRPAGVLVALGGVQFRTLGGYGTCDELQVVPGTGEVVVTGKVSVTSNWGKAETTATADKMTFRLGTDAKK